MNDVLKLADEKLLIQKRIIAGINGLRRHRVNRADVSILDRIVPLVAPRLAYQNRGKEALSFVPFLHREKAQVPFKFAVVVHEIAILLQRYWELIRSDQTTGLYPRLKALEGWAKYGLEECELLGGPGVGYSLFNVALQKEGE